MGIIFEEGEGRNRKQYVEAVLFTPDKAGLIGRATRHEVIRWEVVIKKTGERKWVETLDEAKQLLSENI